MAVVMLRGGVVVRGMRVIRVPVASTVSAVSVSVVVSVGGIPFDVDVELHPFDAALVASGGVKVVAGESQLLEFLTEGPELDAEVEQRPDEHVAAEAAEDVEVEGFHAGGAGLGGACVGSRGFLATGRRPGG